MTAFGADEAKMLAAVFVASYAQLMRDHIISEIKRLAARAGQQPPGSQVFVTATGITESKWRGKYWARWGDALIEAGFQPNSWTGKSEANTILDGLVAACLHYGRLPTKPEISMLRASDPTIPAPKTIENIIGRRAEVITALRNHIADKLEYAVLLAALPEAPRPNPMPMSGAKQLEGHVYLIKSGDFYKVGRSDELERRVREIRIALPDKATLVHAIATDDPPGIEAYWHRRFAAHRANGEWFKLTSEQVKAFRRRKFQ